MGGKPPPAPDYLLIGHLTRDLVDRPFAHERVGGTVAYAGVAASRLGRRVGIVTTYGPDLQLPPELRDLMICRTPCDRTTTFALKPRAGPRSLRLIDRAMEIDSEHVPEAWRSASLVHLAPVAGEIPLAMISWFSPASTVATPQGWLRAWRASGTVIPAPQGLDRLPLERLAALVVSAEDLGLDRRAPPQHGASLPDGVVRTCARAPVLVITRGRQGCTLVAHGQTTEIPPYPAHQIDSTGAGDVFAAAFFVRLGETNDPVASALFASCAAALSVEGVGMSRIPDREQVLRGLRAEGGRGVTRHRGG